MSAPFGQAIVPSSASSSTRRKYAGSASGSKTPRQFQPDRSTSGACAVGHTAVVKAALLLVLALALAGAAIAAAPRPALSLADRDPLALRGTGFGSAERIRVVVDVGERHVRVVRATSGGRFVATFPGVSVRDPCSLDARAAGARGSHAKLPQRFCPPPLAPGGAGP
jgi:hypothetical protein